MGTSKPFLTVKTRHLYNKIYTLFNIYIMCWDEKNNGIGLTFPIFIIIVHLEEELLFQHAKSQTKPKNVCLLYFKISDCQCACRIGEHLKLFLRYHPLCSWQMWVVMWTRAKKTFKKSFLNNRAFKSFCIGVKYANRSYGLLQIFFLIDDFCRLCELDMV